jgi:hypothetical protein
MQALPLPDPWASSSSCHSSSGGSPPSASQLPLARAGGSLLVNPTQPLAGTACLPLPLAGPPPAAGGAAAAASSSQLEGTEEEGHYHSKAAVEVPPSAAASPHGDAGAHATAVAYPTSFAAGECPPFALEPAFVGAHGPAEEQLVRLLHAQTPDLDGAVQR